MVIYLQTDSAWFVKYLQALLFPVVFLYMGMLNILLPDFDKAFACTYSSFFTKGHFTGEIRTNGANGALNINNLLTLSNLEKKNTDSWILVLYVDFANI